MPCMTQRLEQWAQVHDHSELYEVVRWEVPRALGQPRKLVLRNERTGEISTMLPWRRRRG